MAQKCSKCGNWYDQYLPKCPKCGTPSTAKQQESGPGEIKKWIPLAKFIAYFLIITFGLIMSFKQPLISLGSGIAGIFGLIVALYLFNRSLPVGILAVSGIMVGIIIGLTILPGTLHALEGTGFDFDCMKTNLLNGNLGGLGTCYQPTSPETQEGEKVVGSDVISLKLGNMFGSEYKPPSNIQRKETYETDVIITNVYCIEGSKSACKLYGDVNDIVIGEGEIKNRTCSLDADCIKLVPEECKSVDEHCVLSESRPSKSITLESEKEVNYKVKTDVDLIAEVSYAFEGSGDNSFIIVSDENTVNTVDDLSKVCGDKKVAVNKPCAGPGPLDIIVGSKGGSGDFYYIVGDSKNKNVEVLIRIENTKEKGEASLESIKISVTGDVKINEGKCTLKAISFRENEEKDLDGLTLTDERTVKCNYEMSDVELEAGTYKILTFNVELKYRYKETVEYKGLKVVS